MSRIEYRPPAAQVLQRYNFDLPQAEFLAAGSYSIPISGAVFMMLMYEIPSFNNTWNTNNPNIIFLTDNLTFNRVILGFTGGGNFSNPVFTKYPDANIDATISANSAIVQWAGDAGLIAAAPLMNFSLFYVLRTF
jgi:hypothetical protein